MAFVYDGWDGFSNFWKWRDRVASLYGFDWLFKPKQEERIKALAHSQAFFLTRQQAGLGSKKIYEKRVQPASADYKRVRKELVATWENSGREAKNAPTVIGWLRRAAGGHDAAGRQLDCWKYAELANLLTGDLHEEPTVVWCQYSLEVRRAVLTLRAAGASVTYVQGTTPLGQRAARRGAFFQGTRKVIVCQTATAMRGFDLSCSSTSIYLSSPWSCEQRLQSEARTEHPQKKDSSLAIDLVTSGSIDEDVLESVNQKNERVEWLAERIK
jgi:hypothetical protein